MTAARWSFALLALIAAGCGGTGGRPAETAPAPDFSRITGSTAYASRAQLERGWKTDFRRHVVPLSEFERGGPGRDGIRAVDRPRLVPVRDVRFLAPEEPVLELVVRGEARAYPFGILLLHEIVNDGVAGLPVVVTFCPLCNTALAFERRVQGRTLSFGVTGNLRNSDLVMYDRQTESWWQQFGGRGLVGRYAGARLKRLPSRGVPWSEFERGHPDGVVVTTRSEAGVPYGKNPYLGYLDPATPAPFSAANVADRRLPPSERVVLVEVGDRAAAVPFSTLERRHELVITLAGQTLTVRLHGATAEVRDRRGRLVPFSEPFWFAVAAFRPDVTIVR